MLLSKVYYYRSDFEVFNYAGYSHWSISDDKVMSLIQLWGLEFLLLSSILDLVDSVYWLWLPVSINSRLKIMALS